jgi:hypothetical protein
MVVGMRSGRNFPKYEETIVFYLTKNAPAQRSVLAKYFLAKNIRTTLEHPPYCPDMVQAEFYQFLIFNKQ